MNEKELQEHLAEMIHDAGETGLQPDLRDAKIYTLKEWGAMTNDTGLIVILENDDRFQLTIQKQS